METHTLSTDARAVLLAATREPAHRSSAALQVLLERAIAASLGWPEGPAPAADALRALGGDPVVVLAYRVVRQLQLMAASGEP